MPVLNNLLGLSCLNWTTYLINHAWTEQLTWLIMPGLNNLLGLSCLNWTTYLVYHAWTEQLTCFIMPELNNLLGLLCLNWTTYMVYYIWTEQLTWFIIPGLNKPNIAHYTPVRKSICLLFMCVCVHHIWCMINSLLTFKNLSEEIIFIVLKLLYLCRRLTFFYFRLTNTQLSVQLDVQILGWANTHVHSQFWNLRGTWGWDFTQKWDHTCVGTRVSMVLGLSCLNWNNLLGLLCLACQPPLIIEPYFCS